MACNFKLPAAGDLLEGHYKRPLPEPLVALSTAPGRQIFQEAMQAGSMHCFFPLMEQFLTQMEPTYCGVSSLVMVLNAMQIDPQRLWKGKWRWYSEEIADCCQQLVNIDTTGITMPGLALLAGCNGLVGDTVHANDTAPGLAALRQDVLRVCAGDTNRHRLNEALIASYARAPLGQTGDGHFSPIGGYHAARDLVLMLDVARFKYPPHWVPMSQLWDAMQAIDPDTDLPRGYLRLAVRSETDAMPVVPPCAAGCANQNTDATAPAS